MHVSVAISSSLQKVTVIFVKLLIGGKFLVRNFIIPLEYEVTIILVKLFYGVFYVISPELFDRISSW